MTLKEFKTKYISHAMMSEKKSGINHLFTLGQAALESANGKSAPGNNFFGIKATKNTPADKRQLLRTKEVFSDDKQGYRFPEVLGITTRKNAKTGKTEYVYSVRTWFRKYDTPEECFTDHCDLFVRVSRYHKALEHRNDPYRFAEEIAKAGYATGTNYATVLKDKIKQIENT